MTGRSYTGVHEHASLCMILYEKSHNNMLNSQEQTIPMTVVMADVCFISELRKYDDHL